MTSIHRKKSLPYSASQMFGLVDDIDQYKLFLPWCKDSRVLSRTDDEVRATLILSAGGLHKSFTTCNRLQKDKMIEISLVNGPFRLLEGFWRFHADTETRSTVEFDLAFEFSSKFLSLAFAPVFHQVASTLVDAFEKRAKHLYG